MLLLFECWPPSSVDITGHVHWMWLGCVIGANSWFHIQLDVTQGELVFRQLDVCFVALSLTDWTGNFILPSYYYVEPYFVSIEIY